jgi:NAD(P)-dependent dehydrogenase (short-subunit alcohol dehydrogenase family)
MLIKCIDRRSWRRVTVEHLNGKVAVVTGGGSGIGAAVVRACASAGMAVAVVDRDAARASAVAEEVGRAGGKAMAIDLDVSDEDQIESMAEAVFATLGGCHLLHNNAGVFPVGYCWEHGAEEWRQVLDVNLVGVVNGVNAFVPRLLEQRQPAHIVNTASADALRYGPSTALYKATKFAVLGFTETLRYELAPHGIGVSALCPAGVATNLFDTMYGTADAPRPAEQVFERLGAMQVTDESHRTIITAEQVAGLVLEGVRNDEPYIITHPGSAPAITERHAAIDSAYRLQRERHAELP